MLLRRTASVIQAIFILLTVYTTLSAFLGTPYTPLFTPLITVFAFTFAILHSAQRLGWKQTLAFVAVAFLISLAFESVGVATGLVYGPYHYTDKLGVKFLGLVPLLIPLAWFMMMYPSYVIARRILRPVKEDWKTILSVAALGAVAMTAWDLVMDPMMVAGQHWVWEVQGPYFGIPLQNYSGWWLTTFSVLVVFGALRRVIPMSADTSPDYFDRQAVLSYAIVAASGVAVGLRAGLDGPALVGLFAMFPWIAWGWQGKLRVD